MGTPYVQFGNIRLTNGWEMNYVGGGEPSVCVIRTVPHLSHLEAHGDLVFGEEGVGELLLRDCVLETPRLSENRAWELPILDRRWRWRFGWISGSYNKRRADKTLLREKTPQELAALCLEQMGERRGNWDVGRLPNFARPEIAWDCDNPKDMLDDLVAQLGCSWTLDYFEDRVVIWPIGQGLELPEGPTIARAAGLAAVVKPDRIEAASGHVIYQARFATEAVGLDTDGKWKKLADLSYVPLVDPDPESFSNTGVDDNKDDGLATYTDDAGETKKIRDLAKGTCYRAYRLIGIVKTGNAINADSAPQGDGWAPEELKGGDKAPELFVDIKLRDTRAEQYIDDDGPDGTPRKVEQEPQVVARWFDSETQATPSVPKKYDGGVSVNVEFGIIITSDPLYLLAGEAPRPAEVFVDISFLAGRDGLYVRQSKVVETGERNDTKPRLIKRDEIEQRVIQRYTFNSSGDGYQATLCSTLRPLDENGSVEDQLQHWIDAALKEYELLSSGTRHYKRLMPIVPDGRIRQVTWSGGGGEPATTRASVNTEHNPYVATIEDKRRKRAADLVANLAGNERLRRGRPA